MDPLTQLAEELLLVPNSSLREMERLLQDKRQVIFCGPPGTGKTYVARKLAEHFAGSEERVRLVQFHPSYAYEDFVEGYRPHESESGQPGFQLTPGPLKRIAEAAMADEDEVHVLGRPPLFVPV